MDDTEYIMIPKHITQKTAIFLGIVIFWVMIFLLFTINAKPVLTPEEARAKLLEDSVKYVRMLAEETRNVEDGPYAHNQRTGYDLKKTLAFLLDSMLGRLDRLERIVGNLQKAARDMDNDTINT